MGTERFPTLYYYYHPTRRFLHSSHFPIVLLTLVRYRLVYSARCHISGAPTTFTTPFPYSCAGSAPHNVRFPTRIQHLLLNLHDAHYHTHLLTRTTTHLLKSQTTHLVSSNGHSGELFVFPYGWLSKDFEEGGVGTRREGTLLLDKRRHPKNYIILHTGYGLYYILHNLVTGERGKDSSSAKFG